MGWGNISGHTSAEARRLEALFPYLTGRTVAEKTSVAANSKAGGLFAGMKVMQVTVEKTVEKRPDHIEFGDLSESRKEGSEAFGLHVPCELSTEEREMLVSGMSMILDMEQGSIMDKCITTVHANLERLIKERAKIPVTTL